MPPSHLAEPQFSMRRLELTKLCFEAKETRKPGWPILAQQATLRKALCRPNGQLRDNRLKQPECWLCRSCRLNQKRKRKLRDAGLCAGSGVVERQGGAGDCLENRRADWRKQ